MVHAQTSLAMVVRVRRRKATTQAGFISPLGTRARGQKLPVFLRWIAAELAFGMGEDEVDDGLGVIESVRVMADARFADELDGGAEGDVAVVDEFGVFLPGDDVIGVAIDVEKGDFVRGELGELVDGIAGPGESGGFVGEVPEFEDEGPVFGVAFAFALAAGPAFEVADGGVAVDAGDAVGMGDGPLVAVEAAAAEADEGGFFGKGVAGGEFGVELVPVFHGEGAAEHVRDFEVDDVVAFAEEGDVGGGFVAEEFAVPDPGISRGGLFGDDDRGEFGVDFEFVFGEAVPVAGFAGEGGGGEAGELAGFGIEFSGFGLGFGERQAGFDAGAFVTGLGEPGVAK